jgi:hypothetical protein
MKIINAGSMNFSILSGTLTPARAISRLAGNPYGVILEGRELHGLVTVDDLKLAVRREAPSLLSREARLPPTIIAGSNIEMLTFIESGASSCFRLGAHGAVLIDSTGVAGVVTADVVDRYVKRNRLRYTYAIEAPSALQFEIGGSSGGYMLGGAISSGIPPERTGAFVEVKCTTCGWLNLLPFVPPDDENLPECTNRDPAVTRHQLRVAR